jgi:hypothetical protein
MNFQAPRSGRFVVALGLGISVLCIAGWTDVRASANTIRSVRPQSSGMPARNQHIEFQPPSVTFTPKRNGQILVSVHYVKGGGVDSSTSIVSNNCRPGKRAIAIVDGSLSEYGVYAINPGTLDGQCSFTVQDATTGFTATEPIRNRSNRARHKLVFVPPSVTLTGKSGTSVTVLEGSSVDSTTVIVDNTCGSGSKTIASIDDSFSEYGIYAITAGPVNGKCSFTVQDVTNGAKGTEYITNSSNP